jgi:hypothetical protein
LIPCVVISRWSATGRIDRGCDHGIAAPSGRSFSSDPSKLNGQTFPDFVHPLFKRVESGVKGFIVKVKYVAQHEKSEKPVVTFHVEQHLLNRVTYGDNRIQQNVHRIPCSREKGNSGPEERSRPGALHLETCSLGPATEEVQLKTCS